MSIAELQVYSVEEAGPTGGVCVVRCIGGVARAGQVYAAGELRLWLRRIERHGRGVDSFDAGHSAKVHLTGAVVALLTRGQVLTSVPPDAHSLEALEDWLATDPPLVDEPYPRTLRVLAVGRMQDDGLPDGIRLRWGRVAVAATHRCAAAEGTDELAWWSELAHVRAYMIRTLGPERGGDPAVLCREVLDLFDLTPAAAAAEARTWRDLPPPRILYLRRIKNLVAHLTSVRPCLRDTDPVAAEVDAWSAVRPHLP
ncbi:hypothetical protein [Streptomyces sp. NPDC088762]|uniref:hypothetical protein n=1 Tax=Streptomyces sp. NPDC088762 TaxID=3365891 RepID=UPI003800013F